jgi:glyoxylase-like metal-dependent hydrolase (beta-lactamase superfamily II)
MIHTIALPTPFAVGKVNCYLVDDDPLTLVDTGPNSATSLTALEAGLAEHGRRVEDLERIVLTHQHHDHIGLAQILAERSGADVCALDLLAPWLARYAEEIELDDRFAEQLMLRHGVPPDVASALRALTATFRGWGAAVNVTQPLVDGSALTFARREWQVLHRPGHSPSDTIFHDEASGEVFGGDHLIKHISSNALVTRGLRDGADGGGARPKSLLTYIASLRATRTLDARVVLPGHGDPVEGHRELIDDRLASFERRADKLAGLLAPGPRTAFGLAQDMWGNVAVTQTFLTISEVLGHLDLLIARGAIVEEEHEGLLQFALTG